MVSSAVVSFKENFEIKIYIFFFQNYRPEESVLTFRKRSFSDHIRGFHPQARKLEPDCTAQYTEHQKVLVKS